MTEARDPALVARMEALVRELSKEPPGGEVYECLNRFRAYMDDANAIVVLLPEPVDPDILLARKCLSDAYAMHENPMYAAAVHEVISGNADDQPRMRGIVAAIRRVREQERPRSDCPCKDASSGGGA